MSDGNVTIITAPEMPVVHSGRGAFVGRPTAWVLFWREKVGRRWEGIRLNQRS